MKWLHAGAIAAGLGLVWLTMIAAGYVAGQLVGTLLGMGAEILLKGF